MRPEVHPTPSAVSAPAPTVTHPLLIRITHWINAAAMIVMILSGLEIHNAYPILPFAVPGFLTLGGWLGGGLRWHFAAMWVLALNGLVYLAYGILSGRFQRRFFPLSFAQVFHETRAALQGSLRHDDTAYNSVQKLLYLGVIMAGVLVVVSGLALWKPVQFWPLTMLLGDFDNARIVHFLAMSAISAFLVLHVVMALLVPRTLKAMITGRAGAKGARP
jgi:thiosulfate reductase cytochrome b subunit